MFHNQQVIKKKRNKKGKFNITEINPRRNEIQSNIGFPIVNVGDLSGIRNVCSQLQGVKMVHRATRPLAVMLLTLLLLASCETGDPLSTPPLENEVDQSRDLRKRTESFDSKYFHDLEDLSRTIATKQNTLRADLVNGMKKSKIKENIINLSKALRERSSQPFATNGVTGIESIYNDNMKGAGKLGFAELLSSLSKDINAYFPVREHRQNVFERGEDFWVAFNPPLHDESEYFVTAYNKNGQEKTLSSMKVPSENVMVLAYSENQERYSMQLLPCGDEDCGGGGGGGTTYYEGLRLVSVRTDNINDGWLDGDLELRIKVHQAAFTVSHPFGTSTISAYVYLNIFKNHDAGSWGIFGWNDSNKWTTINAYRKWSERLSVTVNGATYHNPIFLMEVTEEDPFFNDNIGEASFNSDTYSWGSALYVVNGSKKCRVVIDKGLYPSTVYN